MATEDFYTTARALGASYLVSLDAVTGVTDLSGNGRTTTLAGSPTIGGYTPGPLVDDNGASDFVGSQGLDKVTGYTPFVNGEAQTFTGWAYRDTSTTQDVLMAGQIATLGPRLYLYQATNDVRFDASVGAGSTVTWSNAWPGNGEWVHWGLVFDEANDTADLYLNGALISQQSATTAYNASPGPLTFTNQWGSNYFDGKMAGLAVFESALTAGDMLTLYRSGLDLFGTTVPGFVTDKTGNIVVTTSTTGASYDVIPGFYTSPEGWLVVTTTTTNAEWDRGFLRLNDALVVEEAAGTYGSIGSGFTTTSSGALSVVNDGTVDWVNGFMRDSDDSLGVTGLA